MTEEQIKQEILSVLLDHKLTANDALPIADDLVKRLMELAEDDDLTGEPH